MSTTDAKGRQYATVTSKLATQLGVDLACALDVIYLRSRKKRWTRQLESELIRLHKAGTPPDMNTFGCGKGVVLPVLVNRNIPIISRPVSFVM